jgi:pilus assembly protein CpaB
MRLVSILIVTFALVLAGLVLFVVPRLMNRGVEQAQLAAQQAVQQTRLPASNVLVAAHNLPAGAVVKPEDIRWQRWPDEGLDQAYLVQEKGADVQKDAVGHTVLHGIGIGQPIIATNLLKPGDAGFLAAALTPGMRAVSVKIDAGTGVSGFILPGDHVDVLLAEHYELGQAAGGSESDTAPKVRQKDVESVILRNVRVLAIDQAMQDIDSKPKVGVTTTLEVDLAQAQKLALAVQMGSLSLALRSFTAPDKPEPEGGTGIVQDYQVSPYRAAILQQQQLGAGASGQASAEALAARGALRVYRGTAVATGSGQ